MYQDMYDRAKKIVKKEVCMIFHNVSRPLYLETDALGVNLGTTLLKVKDGMNCGHDEVPDNTTLHPTAFASKTLSHAEWHYSNIQHEALEILHGLEKFHYY